MKTIYLKKHLNSIQTKIKLTASKSESNRVLLINALAEKPLQISNLSAARDTQTMISLINENPNVWDVKDAGTTMRFCTAFLAVRGKNQTITGTERMKQRPIKILAEALKSLGAEIEYLENEGFPPLKISQLVTQKTQQLTIPGNISSQYISALLMIAPSLPQGLTIQLEGEVFSLPYIKMTLSLMQHFGIQHIWEENKITISNQKYTNNTYTIESDWSGASYWYSIASFSKNSKIILEGLRKNSFQGDAVIANIMKNLGVDTQYFDDSVLLTHEEVKIQNLTLDFKDCPDLAQTVMVVATVKGVKLKMTGLESLRIKETDRIMAMKNELLKINAQLNEKKENGKLIWYLTPHTLPTKVPIIDTYDDHRMAMAFAPLCLIYDIEIQNPDVVNKSYPDFWKHLQHIGIEIIK